MIPHARYSCSVTYELVRHGLPPDMRMIEIEVLADSLGDAVDVARLAAMQSAGTNDSVQGVDVVSVKRLCPVYSR